MARSTLPDTLGDTSRNATNRLLSPTSASEVPGHSIASNLIRSIRPSQWSKNLIVFAGLLFGRRLFSAEATMTASAAFVIFCALSSAMYLVNDVLDRDSDRRHPLKAQRPIASGALAVSTALGAAAILSALGLASAFAINIRFGLVSALYLALLGLYSTQLKHIVIVDVLTIAAGFVLRAAA